VFVVIAYPGLPDVLQFASTLQLSRARRYLTCLVARVEGLAKGRLEDLNGFGKFMRGGVTCKVCVFAVFNHTRVVKLFFRVIKNF